LTSLVRHIDQELEETAGKRQRPLGVYVIFDSKVEGLDKQLSEMAEKYALKQVSLCIGAAPDDYEVAKDADITVVIYQPGNRRSEKVTANFALKKSELAQAKGSIVKAFIDVLPK
jgi:predicted nucleotidyltransferase